MTYEFEPTQCEETGSWFCRKLVHMSLPVDIGEFEDEFFCRQVCNNLNQIDFNLMMLRKHYDINLRLAEVKR